MELFLEDRNKWNDLTVHEVRKKSAQACLKISTKCV